MRKYIYTRASVFEEVFTVMAESEEEALALISDGAPGVTNQIRDWVDWYHEEYYLEQVEDEVVTFLHSKETV